MSIILLIIILIGITTLWFFVVYAFDIALIKGVINRVKGDIQLNKEELTDAVKRFLENRSLNTAHKVYCRSISYLVCGNSIFSFARGVLIVERGESKYSIDLLYDNGLPIWAILIVILLITIAYVCFLNIRGKRYRADFISNAAAIINTELGFVPNQDWFRKKTEKAIQDLGKVIDLSINFTYEFFDDAIASTCRDYRITKVFAEDIKELYTGFSRERELLVRSIGEQNVLKIEDIITEIRALLSKTSYDGDEPKKVIDNIDEIDNILLDIIRKEKTVI